MNTLVGGFCTLDEMFIRREDEEIVLIIGGNKSKGEVMLELMEAIITSLKPYLV